MRGHLRLWLGPKDGSPGVAFEHDVVCEATEDGLRLFDEWGEEAGYIYDVEIVETVSQCEGDLHMACFMLGQLVNAKLLPPD